MNIALIFAGGTGQRMNTSSIPKQFLLVHGKPIIIHTIENFQNSEAIDKIVVASLKDYIQYMFELKEKYKLSKIENVVPGGKNGQESIYNALLEISKFAKNDDVVLIHDGVRPIVDDDTIKKNIESVKKYGSGITVTPAIEPLLILDDKNKRRVINRKFVHYERAPQSFRFKDIFEAHKMAIKENKLDFIDSGELMSHYGHDLYPIEGSINNIKVTTPMDFFMFKAMLDAKENEQINIL